MTSMAEAGEGVDFRMDSSLTSLSISFWTVTLEHRPGRGITPPASVGPGNNEVSAVSLKALLVVSTFISSSHVGSRGDFKEVASDLFLLKQK